MRTDIDLNYFKKRLEDELTEVDGELKRVGTKNPDVPSNGPTDWEAKPANFDIDTADESEMGDKMEEFEENTAVLKELEMKYNDLKNALKKIAGENYGICEVGGEEIEKDRLEANPAARTCKKHMGR